MMTTAPAARSSRRTSHRSRPEGADVDVLAARATPSRTAAIRRRQAIDGKLQAYAITAEAHAAFQAARQANGAASACGADKDHVPTSGLADFAARRSRDSPGVRATSQRAGDSPTPSRTISSRSPADDRFEYLTYEITDRPTPTSLEIGVRQKTYGPPFLMVGLDLNNIDSTNFAVNLSARVLHYGLLGAGSEPKAGLRRSAPTSAWRPKSSRRWGRRHSSSRHGSTSIGVGGTVPGRRLRRRYREPQGGVGFESEATSAATPRCASATMWRVTPGAAESVRPICLPSTVPNGTRTSTSAWTRRPVPSCRRAGSACARPCASSSRRRRPTVSSTASSSTARNRSRAARCGRPGSGGSGARRSPVRHRRGRELVR